MQRKVSEPNVHERRYGRPLAVRNRCSAVVTGETGPQAPRGHPSHVQRRRGHHRAVWDVWSQRSVFAAVPFPRFRARHGSRRVPFKRFRTRQCSAIVTVSMSCDGKSDVRARDRRLCIIGASGGGIGVVHIPTKETPQPNGSCRNGRRCCIEYTSVTSFQLHSTRGGLLECVVST